MKRYSSKYYTMRRAAKECAVCKKPVFIDSVYCLLHLIMTRLESRKRQGSLPHSTGRRGRKSWEERILSGTR